MDQRHGKMPFVLPREELQLLTQALDPLKIAFYGCKKGFSLTTTWYRIDRSGSHARQQSSSLMRGVYTLMRREPRSLDAAVEVTLQRRARIII